SAGEKSGGIFADPSTSVVIGGESAAIQSDIVSAIRLQIVPAGRYQLEVHGEAQSLTDFIGRSLSDERPLNGSKFDPRNFRIERADKLIRFEQRNLIFASFGTLPVLQNGGVKFLISICAHRNSQIPGQTGVSILVNIQSENRCTI